MEGTRRRRKEAIIHVIPATPSECTLESKEGSLGDDQVEAVQLGDENEDDVNTEKKKDSIDSVPNETNLILQSIPQPKWNYGFFNSLRLKLKGRNFYQMRMNETKSSVFAVNFKSRRAVILDIQAYEQLQDESIILKQFNGCSILKTNRFPPFLPRILVSKAMFLKEKDSLREYLSVFEVSYILQTLVDHIPIQFRIIEKSLKLTPQPFEALLHRFSAIVLNTLFLQRQMDQQRMDAWIDGFMDNTKLPHERGKFTEAQKYIYKSVGNSSLVRVLLDDIKSDESIDQDEIVKGLAFEILYNCYGPFKALLLSCIICLSWLHVADKRQMKREASLFFKSPKCAELFNDMPSVDGFIFEVIRLYPPKCDIFATAAQNFTLCSRSGYFRVFKDQLIQGRTDFALRDASLFSNPDKLHIDRYINRPDLKQLVMSTAWMFAPTVSSEDISWICFAVLKLAVAQLLFCDIVPAQELVWTGRNTARHSASDRPIQIDKFTVHNPNLNGRKKKFSWT